MAIIIKIIEKSLIFLNYLRKTVLKGGHTLRSPGISEGIQKKKSPIIFVIYILRWLSKILLFGGKYLFNWAIKKCELRNNLAISIKNKSINTK